MLNVYVYIYIYIYTFRLIMFHYNVVCNGIRLLINKFIYKETE